MQAKPAEPGARPHPLTGRKRRRYTTATKQKAIARYREIRSCHACHTAALREIRDNLGADPPRLNTIGEWVKNDGCAVVGLPTAVDAEAMGQPGT